MFNKTKKVGNCSFTYRGYFTEQQSAEVKDDAVFQQLFT